jgi:hypothetical protein
MAVSRAWKKKHEMTSNNEEEPGIQWISLPAYLCHAMYTGEMYGDKGPKPKSF